MPKKKKSISKPPYWTPRILSIIFLLFLALFSLDVFEPGLSAKRIALGLFMHNLPVLILAILLIIAWKHELVGAVTFFLAGLAYILLLVTGNNFEWFMLSWALIISGPAFLIGFLFLINWKRKKNSNFLLESISLI